MKRSRPKTKAPTTGWVISVLAGISGMPVRRLRDYVFRGLIQPLERRGTATRYQRSQLVRLMAIKRMRAASGFELSEFKRRMDAMDEREPESLPLSTPLTPAVLEALGHPAADSNIAGPATHGTPDIAPTIAPAVPVEGSPNTGNGEPQSPLATWYHFELLPGLTLQLRANASPAVKDAARSI
jgi:DNA-binding transcriptional MerR regulator